MRPVADFGSERCAGRGSSALFVSGLIVFALGLATTARAQSPPDVPPITSPLTGQVVSPFDVHMEAGPFSDPDPGDTHFCTDWEIWTLSPLERVWVTSCITGVEKVHTHLGDGTFENSHSGRTTLLYSTNYKLRVRFRDNTGLWSAFAERPFSTGALTQVFPLIANDVVGGATWQDEFASAVILPAGSTQPRLRIESGSGALLLQLSGNDGVTNAVTNPAALPADASLRVMIDGGSTGLSLAQSRVAFTDGIGIFHTVYLPAAAIPASGQVYFWISADGSTYVGSAIQTSPDFSTLARGSPVPWTVFQPGYEVEVVATGFQLPVNIAFVPNPGPNPTDPYYYVTELYGTIKVIARNGTVSNYASGLLNFNPTGAFPGSGEQGLAGIVMDPVSGDLFAGMLYDSAPPNGPHYPKVVRFHSTDGGRTAATQTTILSMPGEEQGQSHFISNFSIGPDGKLYVHMGDGFNSVTALDLNSFRGKILRMNLDGSAASDNPFYNAANGITARDYIFAYGFRNPFGGAWRAADGKHYEVENGLSANDRFARVLQGVSYGWNGDDATMTTNAIYNWNPTVAPVNIAFIQPATFGGSSFPSSMYDNAFVTISGSTYEVGPSTEKAIVRFVVDTSGNLVSGPTPLIQYNGVGHATAVGLAAGPDGLYFTDLYKDLNASSPIDPGANVLRIKYRGIADFSASALEGPTPLSTTFTDHSDISGISGWFWEFGDGQTSTDQTPTHLYASEGVYTVRLTVTSPSGATTAEKSAYIVVGSFQPGLMGSYYLGQNLSNFQQSRIDPTVDFDWGTGPPAPGMPNDGFSVRWTGVVQPQFSETYTMYTATDDGARLWVNDQLIIDHWVDQALTEWSAPVSLTAGVWYPIRMEYYENGGGAAAHLSWQSASQAKQAIPETRLRTSAPVTAVETEPTSPVTRVTLFPSAPNPAGAMMRLGFAVPQTGPASLRLFNVHGALVATLFDGVAIGQRRYALPFHAGALASGVYFQRLEASGIELTKKIVVLR
jgi:glucose/arabinose dehydrogenase/PKD repeat protein